MSDDEKDHKAGKITPEEELPDIENTIRLDLTHKQYIDSDSSTDAITPDDFDSTISDFQSTEEETVSSLADDIFNEHEDLPEIDQTVSLDAYDNEDSSPAFTPEYSDQELPLLDETSLEASASEDTESSSGRNETHPPVIDLTEDMLHEPEQPSLPELDDTQDQDSGDSPGNQSEMPELTTTETNILADATSAIREMNADEDFATFKGDTASENYQSPTEDVTGKHSGSLDALPALMGILGIAIGGFASWMAFDTSNQTVELKTDLQALKSSNITSINRQDIADIRQRLDRVERRLTGTPTLEAAAPLGSVASREEPEASKPQSAQPDTETVPKPQKITADVSTGTDDWVVNVSSHADQLLAKKEVSRLKGLGLNAEMHQATIKNKTWFRVQITGFATKDAAKAQLRDIEQRSGIKDGWISKR